MIGLLAVTHLGLHRRRTVVVGLFMLVAALTLAWLPSARAEESLRAFTVDSIMERLILRKQLHSLRENDYPTFFRWYVPIRLAVVSQDENVRLEVERERIEPLLDAFRKSTGFDAKLGDYGPDTNVLLIVGQDPQSDIRFYASKINESANNPNAIPTLTAQAQPGSIPCYRSWRYVEGAVEGAVLYAPAPSQNPALSKKCIASNFAVMTGLIGTPPDGDTITNINNQEVVFTKGDEAALRVLYDKAFHPNMTFGAIERTAEQVMAK